ncbi:ABC transporter substrate-binding protein [Pseudomonas sp. LRF_L74]|uniref:ABC transporter substrate-binding protein n=1 Tax=Pseudomonas sp. LRF_L74 TaxID=3369422 RepID=UPI003F63C914
MSDSTTSIYYTRCPIPTGLGIAVHLGLLKDEFAADAHVALHLLQASDDPERLNSHFSHALDNLIRHGGNIPAIWTRARGADTRVIGLSFVRGPQAVLSLPQSGITTPADLKGKRLLLQRNGGGTIDFQYSTSRRTYEGALRQAGLSFDDVTLVEPDLTPERAAGNNRSASGTIRRAWYTDGLAPLLRGEVDVITSRTIGSPAPQLEFLFGLNRVFDLLDLPDEVQRANNSTPLTLTVDVGFIERHRDLLVRILRRILQAEQWARDNHDEAVRFIAREQAVAEQVVESAFGSRLYDSIALGFDEHYVAALEDQKNYLLQLGYIDNDFAIEDWLDRSLLDEARASL